MDDNQKHLEDLYHIRNLMDRSSRFISLSGLSGVFAGIYAIIGAAVVYYDVTDSYTRIVKFTSDSYNQDGKLIFLVSVAMIVLVASLVTGYLFTSRKAKKEGLKVWDKSSKQMLFSLMYPLVTGGILCVIMLKHGLFGFVAPMTLIFYGMGLLSASKHSFVELKYLGITEIVLGLLGVWFYGYGLLFWTIGFGVMHIFYGGLMYYKYERK
jgi:hypothetical protein